MDDRALATATRAHSRRDYPGDGGVGSGAVHPGLATRLPVPASRSWSTWPAAGKATSRQFRLERAVWFARGNRPVTVATMRLTMRVIQKLV